MSTNYVEQTTALIGRVEGQELLPHAIRLLSDGEPVASEQLAAAAGCSVEDVEAVLRAQTSAERDDQGRLVGLALTLRPTTHRFTVDGRTLFAWCASDTLMLPVVLGRPALVESTCPKTDQAIRIELTPDSVQRVDPPDAVMSAVRPPGQLADVRTATCAHGHFFSSIAATAAWTDAHPDGHIYPVEEAFRLDRQVIKHLGWDGR
ncbi:MAG: organomercurial lyase MerB [Thermoleophilaceae bacterium]